MSDKVDCPTCNGSGKVYPICNICGKRHHPWDARQHDPWKIYSAKRGDK